jgi:hypothetical protein
MPDWDEDSPRLRENLENLLLQIRDQGLTVPNPAMAGQFRGEPGLERVEVRIGAHLGVAAADVSAAVSSFERRLQMVVARLDAWMPPGAHLTTDQLESVLEVCAWAHAEWVRIHPFANGNGRIARLWANSLAMRYGLPPFIRLRPRPAGGYGPAGEAAMRSDWRPTVTLFRGLFEETLRGP